MKRYNPSEIEPKWQKNWADAKIYAAEDFSRKPKFVMLTEFPYPSGAGMHMGHMREYTYGDILARFHRMRGENVLFPMGYDAFGLPTENFAIKNKISPEVATEKNTASFRRQLDEMGFSFDWSRSFATSDPEYYKWTQWMFLQFFKKNLAYQAEIAINWCPFCKTGLANEEVVNGRHERCDNLVEKRVKKQWMLKITDYAERLIDGLREVDFPARIADQQINWIGKSVGAEIDFEITSENNKIFREKLTVFTTRPDTIFGATFMVVAPESDFVAKIARENLAKNEAEIETYVKAAASKSDIERQENREKTGVKIDGICAISPANGEKIPIFVADYVLGNYGTGAIMAVPAHDARDFEFARKFGVEIREVVAPNLVNFGDATPRENLPIPEKLRPCVDAIIINENGEFLLEIDDFGKAVHFVGGGIDGDETEEEALIREIHEETGFTDIKSIKPVSSHITTLGFRAQKNANLKTRTRFYEVILNSRKQEKCEELENGKQTLCWVAKNEVENLVNWAGHLFGWKQYLENSTMFSDSGILINSGEFDGLSSEIAKKEIVAKLAPNAREKINYKLRDWVYSRQHYWGEPIPIIHCAKCGAVAVPEKDLPVKLPKVDHYEPTDDGESPLSRIAEFVNVKCPKCGGDAKRETDTMPNWAGSNWYYLRYFDAKNSRKFADAEKLKYWGEVDLYLGGMEHTTLHLLYSRFHHQFLYDQNLVPTPEPYAARRGQGIVLAADGRKMSKSLGNVVDPTAIIESGYGADAARLAVAFLAPYDQTTPWSPETVVGCYKFLARVWNLSQEIAENSPNNSENRENQNANSAENSSPETLRPIHKTIQKVREDIEKMNFNTAIAALMECVNELNKIGVSRIAAKDFAKFVQIIAPFAPHIAEEIWREILGEKSSIHLSEFPRADEKYLRDENMKIAVQVNGKLRGEISVAVETSRENIEKLALAQENVAKFLKQMGDKKPAKIIYVAGKIVNIVVK